MYTIYIAPYIVCKQIALRCFTYIIMCSTSDSLCFETMKLHHHIVSMSVSNHIMWASAPFKLLLLPVST